MANLEFCTAVPIATESELKCEKKATYKELNGLIWNNLVDTMSVLRQICMHLEGDASTPKDIPEFKCYRDVLEASNNLTYEVLKVVNQIAEVIGVA